MENTAKIALITGGSRGLGKDMALRLGQKGIDVIITYHSKAQEISYIFSKMQRELAPDYFYKYDLLRHLVIELIHYG